MSLSKWLNPPCLLIKHEYFVVVIQVVNRLFKVLFFNSKGFYTGFLERGSENNIATLTVIIDMPNFKCFS